MKIKLYTFDRAFLTSLLVIVSVVGVSLAVLASSYPEDVSASDTTSTPPVVGAYFIYWHDCPNNNCDFSPMPYPGAVHEYSSSNKEWYKSEFSDMKAAGLDAAILVSWGSGHPSFTWFRDETALPLMVQALDEIGGGLKIGYMDDTNSVVAEWNYDNGRGYAVPTTDPEAPLMPLDQENWTYFYDRKIKVFFQKVPRRYWMTHNGQTVKNGGRPVVMIYDAPRSFVKRTQADEMWQAIRAAFIQDFGVNPFIILEQSWTDLAYNPQGDRLKNFIDGDFVWAGGIDELAKRRTLKGYTTVSIDAGFACPEGDIYAGCVERPRNVRFLSDIIGHDAIRLTTMYKKEVPNSNLVLVNSWNEMWEGTAINRNTSYPKASGGFLPEDYYIKVLNNLINTVH